MTPEHAAWVAGVRTKLREAAREAAQEAMGVKDETAVAVALAVSLALAVVANSLSDDPPQELGFKKEGT